MPQYEDLARRAVLAGERAEALQADARHIWGLAQILRDAHAGHVCLIRCAWCDRYKVEGDWLHLTAIGTGQQQIASSLRRRATHGMCPSCFKREQALARASRTRDPH